MFEKACAPHDEIIAVMDQAWHSELWDWCQKHGASKTAISAALVAEGWRGVVATASIRKNSCILVIPIKLLISEQSALRDHHLQECLAGCRPPPQTLLALHLLNEMAKGQNSFWSPYLATLPRSYGTAMGFSDAAVDELQVAAAQQAAAAAVEATLQQWRAAGEALQALELPPKWRSKAAWLWAASTLSSRTMFMPKDEAGALAPFGDLHNFGSLPPPITPQLGQSAGRVEERNGGLVAGDGHLDESAEAYRIFARRDYAAGEQVLLCYGRHTNLELLIHYGFVLASNPHDTAVLPCHLLPQLSLAAPPAVHADGNPSFELLRALRLAGASPEERREKACLALNDEPISTASERWALSTLCNACVEALAALPTTRREDEALLVGGGVEGCTRVAVEWRLCYKRALGSAVKRCAAALEELRVTVAARVSMPSAAVDGRRFTSNSCVKPRG